MWRCVAGVALCGLVWRCVASVALCGCCDWSGSVWRCVSLCGWCGYRNKTKLTIVLEHFASFGVRQGSLSTNWKITKLLFLFS